MRVIENDILKVAVADHGAELCSVYDKEADFERIWDANPAVWNRHAPILFPFVGKVRNGEYRIGDKTYAMKTQHGFARDMEYVCVNVAKDSITHKVCATEDTLKIYPYDFELTITHRLDAENPRLLHVDWEVKNNSEEEMVYSIGAHPGFALPIVDYKERENYYLMFPNKEELTYVGASLTSGLGLPNDKKKLPLEDGFVKYYDDIYATFIFDYQNIDVVGIARPDKTPYVTVNCAGFPLLGIWTSPDGGNYICLEPWYGRADDEGFTGTIDEKPGVLTLAPGGVETITYSMEFHK